MKIDNRGCNRYINAIRDFSSTVILLIHSLQLIARQSVGISTKKIEIKIFKRLTKNNIKERKSLYLITRLSNIEKKLFENEDFDHLTSYLWFWSGKNPDVQVNVKDPKDSDSVAETECNSKCVRWACERKTIIIDKKSFFDIFNCFESKTDSD